MQTCSNCGASNREGAKFCTTCGSRLNAVIESSQGSGWNSPSAVEETAPESTDEVTTTPPAPDPDGETQPVYTDEPVATSWSWNQTRTSEELAVPVPDVTTTPPPADDLPSWASQWTSSDPDPEPGVTTTQEPGPVTSSEAVEPIATVDAVEERVAPASEVQDNPAALFDAEPVSVDREAPTAKARAQVLLHELQELLDESFPAPASAASGDTGPALATLQGVPGDRDRFENLRAILEKARSQPRDVDTMLNLLGEIDNLIALLDSHEAYVSAVDTARGQLEG